MESSVAVFLHRRLAFELPPIVVLNRWMLHGVGRNSVLVAEAFIAA